MGRIRKYPSPEKGDRYDKLKVIREVEGKRNRTIFVKCDCGRHLEVSFYHLKDGKVTSCGCKKSRPRGFKLTSAFYFDNTEKTSIWQRMQAFISKAISR